MKLILIVNKYKNIMFLFSILINIGFVSFIRNIDINSSNTPWFSAVIILGLIYNLLKIIDSLYYVYYMNESINILSLYTYILFIPIFTSGPIIQYNSFKKQLNTYKKIESKDVEVYVKRIISGLFKKVVLVKILLEYYSNILNLELNPLSSTLVLIIYFILLYFDFSGYSDIAIGFSGLMGIQVPENFKKPFTSPTLTQFWRNWHITLGDWFKSHVYMPFSQNFRSRISASFLSFGIMLTIGLWHGFNTLFILWGVYHGAFLFLENILNITIVHKRKVSKIYFTIRCLITNLIVAFGTIFFSENLTYACPIIA